MDEDTLLLGLGKGLEYSTLRECLIRLMSCGDGRDGRIYYL